MAMVEVYHFPGRGASVDDLLAEGLKSRKQLIEDIDQEIKWQSSLENPDTVLDKLGEKALRDSEEGKTRESGFDEL